MTTDTKFRPTENNYGPTIPAQADQHIGAPPNTTNSANRDGGFCCASPNGNYTFLPSLLTTIAFILSTYAHYSCRFIKREFDGEGDATDIAFNAFTLGIWSFMDPLMPGFCFRYPSNLELDPYFQTSRAMAPISAILGGIMMVNFWFAACIGMTRSCWRFCGFILTLTTVFEGLTLIILKSDFCKQTNFSCKLSTGANLAIAATVLYFFAAISVCNTPSPRGFPEQNIRTVRTETIQPDGTRTIETRQIVDGCA